jgi:hypothetical protein
MASPELQSQPAADLDGESMLFLNTGLPPEWIRARKTQPMTSGMNAISSAKLNSRQRGWYGPDWSRE